MKIIHLCLDAPFNEGWGYQENLLPKYQQKQGNEVLILTTNTMQSGYEIINTKCIAYTLRTDVQLKRLTCMEIGIPPLSKIKKKYDIYEILLEFKPDIIFSHGMISYSIYQAIYYKNKINKNCKIYQDNHFDEYNNNLNSKSIHSKLKRSYYRNLNKNTYKHIDRIYGVTELSLNYINSYFKIPKDKLQLLHLGADDENINFNDKADISKQIRQMLNIPSDAFVITTGGKIDSVKNIHSLMQAVINLNNPNVHLVIFGCVSGSIKNEFDKLIENANIHFVGWISSRQVYDYFLASQLAVFPGRHSVLWEQAVACKTPALFRWYEGLQHVDIGGNCRYINGDGVIDIQNSLNEIVNDNKLYKQMVDSANSDNSQKFLYSNIAKQTLI